MSPNLALLPRTLRQALEDCQGETFRRAELARELEARLAVTKRYLLLRRIGEAASAIRPKTDATICHSGQG